MVFGTACSTKKNTFTRRLYHNLTSHYNVYWNGRESLREGIADLEKKSKDSYNEILPLFNYGEEGDAQSITPQMDRAIKKASIAIQKHSMVFNGEEKVRWIDDSYMLIGKAYFLKQEYISARRTFNFVIREYGENDIIYDAMLWLSQTYVQLEEYEKVEPLLNLIVKDLEEGLVPYEIEKRLPQYFADQYIKQGKYDEAVDYLYETISYNPPKRIKTRAYFALGQIFQQNGDLNRSTENFRQVIKRNPPYEMAFQAKINMARSYDASFADSKEIDKILRKMLKDEKNKEFRDQIYYAMAEVALKNNNKAKAIELLKESVATSVQNDYQKATSSLKLADLYFEMPDYQNAQAYYDTAMMFLPNDYPDYTTLKSKTSVLSDLVVHLITIQHEDSLQNLVMMSESERNAVIDKIIEEYIAEQERIAAEKELQEALAEIEQQNAQAGTNTPGFPSGAPIGGGREWYFYNTGTKNYGYSEFIKEWGKRKNEDLWRLSNKQISTFGTDDEPLAATPGDTAVVKETLPAESDPLQREYYLKDLPFTEAQMKESNEKLKVAYFQLGKMYYEGLEDFPESKFAFETLNERFPDHDKLLRSFYYLYKVHEELGDRENMEYYKNLIISRFPESDYAKVLEDPEYYKKMSEEKSKVDKLYEEAYQAYQDSRYYMAIAKSDLALNTYGDTIPLAPKFEFVRALSLGRVDVLDTLVYSLKHVITAYPNSEVKTMAQGILMNIIKDHPEYADSVFMAPGQVVEEPSPYNFRAGGQHMFMIVVKSKGVRLNPLKVKISDFNLKYYSLENLSINSIVLDRNHYMVTVGNFNNSQKALKYKRAIEASEYVYSDLNPKDYQNFIISTENYPTFFKEKVIEEYEEFYITNYEKED
jgi:tetratricopeptide (TPR) repeat protein